MSPRDERSARQISRGKRQKAGDRSARIAHELMKISLSSVRKVVLDDELRIVIDRARAITSMVARRRAERTLAGELRRYDLVELSLRLSKVHESENADTELFHLAEEWRARLIEQGGTAIAEFPGGVDAELPRLLDAAKREKTTGRPPGASRALFRHVIELLRAHQAAAEASVSDEDEDDDQIAPADDAAADE